MLSYKYNNTIFIRFFQVFLQRSDNLSVIGIIAEFNPLHNGHKHLISEAKKHGTVVCVISGNFVQRGDTAIYEKRVRAKAALSCGADCVLELPVCYSMSTAQNFCFGGVSLLNAIGCDTIMFGSECGDIQTLIETSDILCSHEFSQKLPVYLESGMTFAAARQKAAEDCGVKKDILASANNNLGIEYIIAAKKINPKIKFKTIQRQGAMHDSDDFSSKFVSASALRKLIKQEDFSTCEEYMPSETFDIFKSSNYSDISRIETAILSTLRTKTKEELSQLPDLSEGVENKLFSQVKTSTSLNALYDSIKVKRYTLARIRRIVLSAFLGVDNRLFLKTPPYMRVLGFNKKGEDLLRTNKSISNIPIILRVNEIDNLNEDAKYMFQTECRATDLYALSLTNPAECGIEYKTGIIKV